MLSSKTQENKVLQAKNFEIFLLATFKTTFWMKNLTQKLKKKAGEASRSELHAWYYIAENNKVQMLAWRKHRTETNFSV